MPLKAVSSLTTSSFISLTFLCFDCSHEPRDYAALASIVHPADLAVVAVKSNYHGRILDEQLERLDAALLDAGTKSTSPRDAFPWLHQDWFEKGTGLRDKWKTKLFVQHNGLRLDHLLPQDDVSAATMREPWRFVYANCYTRGLVPILQAFWPALRALVPSATLHVTYGMEGLTEHQRQQIRYYNLDFTNLCKKIVYQ